VETPIVTRRATVEDLDTLLADVQAGFGSESSGSLTSGQLFVLPAGSWAIAGGPAHGPIDWWYGSDLGSAKSSAAFPQLLPRSTLRVSQRTYPSGNRMATGTVSRFNDEKGSEFVIRRAGVRAANSN
jgi:hypothetical protein